MLEHVCPHLIRNGVSHIVDGNEGSIEDVIFLEKLIHYLRVDGVFPYT